MKLWPKLDIGQNLPGKSPPRSATHINRNGLIKMLELANKRIELMGQAMLKRIQFPCNYLGGKLVGIQERTQPAAQRTQPTALLQTFINCSIFLSHSLLKVKTRRCYRTVVPSLGSRGKIRCSKQFSFAQNEQALCIGDIAVHRNQ